MIGRVYFWILCSWLLTGGDALAEDATTPPPSNLPSWTPDLSPQSAVSNRLIADPGYSVGSAYVDAFMTPELCGATATEPDSDFVEHLIRTFLHRAPNDAERSILTKLLASGYPRRDLTEAVAFRPPNHPPAPEFVAPLAALRWEAVAILYQDVVRWTTGQDFDIADRIVPLLVPIFALYEGADPRRGFADSLLVFSMSQFAEEDTAVFVQHVTSAVLGRAPSELELERYLQLVPAIDRSRGVRAPLWIRFRFIERFFKTSEIVPLRFLNRMISQCQPPLSGKRENDLPLWARTHASMLNMVTQSLPAIAPATPPYLCTPFNTHLITIGHVGSDAIHLGGGCAPNHAFYALDRGARGSSELFPRSAAQVGVTGACCRLPADDILDPNEYRYELIRCPAGYVATGGRSSVNLDRCDNPTDWNCAASQRLANAFIRCTKINEQRYQLARSRSGRLWIEKPNSAREHLPPLLHSDLPAGVRSAVGWRQPLDRMPNGCIGWPIGSLFVEKQGPYCEQHYFRELQYRGLPGDPVAGTPVQMFANCDDVDLSDPNQPRCVRH